MTVIDSDLTTPVLLLAMPQVLDPFFHKSVSSCSTTRTRGASASSSTAHRHQDPRDPEGHGSGLAGRAARWWPTSAVRSSRSSGRCCSRPASRNPTTWRRPARSLPGVAITQHVGDLSRLAESPPDRFRLLLGYAGWGAGQLIQEILRNDWLTAPVQSDLIFAPDPEQVWDAALRSVGVDPAALPSWTRAERRGAHQLRAPQGPRGPLKGPGGRSPVLKTEHHRSAGGLIVRGSRSCSSRPRRAGAGSSPRATSRRGRPPRRRRCARCARRPG